MPWGTAVLPGEDLVEVSTVLIADLLDDVFGGEGRVLQVISGLLELALLQELLEIAAGVIFQKAAEVSGGVAGLGGQLLKASAYIVMIDIFKGGNGDVLAPGSHVLQGVC